MIYTPITIVPKELHPIMLVNTKFIWNVSQESLLPQQQNKKQVYLSYSIELHHNLRNILVSCSIKSYSLLQVPQSSANASVHIDAGLKPIWAVVAERVVSYARQVSSKSSSYWAKMALTYNLSQGNKNAYSKYLGKNMALAKTSLKPSDFVKKDATNAAIYSVLKMQQSTAATRLLHPAQ